MMKIKKLFLALFLVTAFSGALHAQHYDTSLGMRLGYDNGLTLKHILSPTNAGELIFAVSPRYFQLTGMYEYLQPIPETPGLDWYAGLGAHIGGIHRDRNQYSSSFLLGVDLIGGIEYTFPQAPFNISLDWKPSFNFTNSYNDYWYRGFALSVRYTFSL
ncbi:MAG: hypothetical protein LBH72_03725 [Proteiniphilum sp.]|jgi:hypothetical protein|nr:hypothetical protein [Proteiniphilum sp.]